MHAPLDVVGEIQAAVAGETVLVTASHDTITVDIPSLRVGLLALRGFGRRQQRRQTVSRFNAVLRLAVLTVTFRVAGGTVALLGAAARPGILSRLLGVAPIEIRLSGLPFLLRSFWR